MPKVQITLCQDNSQSEILLEVPTGEGKEEQE